MEQIKNSTPNKKGAGQPTPLNLVGISWVSAWFLRPPHSPAGLGKFRSETRYATICAAWFIVAKANGANTANAATRQ